MSCCVSCESRFNTNDCTVTASISFVTNIEVSQVKCFGLNHDFTFCDEVIGDLPLGEDCSTVAVSSLISLLGTNEIDIDDTDPNIIILT